MRTKPNRVYTQEQREEALRLVKEVGLTEAARRLSYSLQTVSFWKNGRKPKLAPSEIPEVPGAADSTGAARLRDSQGAPRQ